MTECQGRPTVGALANQAAAMVDAACMLSRGLEGNMGKRFGSAMAAMLVGASRWHLL